MTKNFTDIRQDELDALIQRVEDAKTHRLTLSASDCQLLIDLLLTLATLHERIASDDITLQKLRKLSGIVKSSEALSKGLSQPNKANKKQKNKLPKSKTPPVKATLVYHALEEFNKGDTCLKCLTGKLYKYEPATLLRITGQSPFVPEQHIMERLRCNTCGAYFTAKMADNVINDGESQQKYGYSARSLIGIAKYGMGSPFYRQASLQAQLGVPITASTQFDQCEYLANSCSPIFNLLKQIASNAAHFYLDDTRHRILQAKPIEKKKRNSEKTIMRTGVYTSGLIATTDERHDIVLFETNIGHAGEFIDSILINREAKIASPILMSDALSSNQPTVCDVQKSLCNSHARRQFYDVYSHFSEEVEDVLTRYQKIWEFDDEATEQKLSSSGRLAYHQAHSLPIMEALKRWGEQHFEKQSVEENSGLGKAIKYFIKHYDGLTAFCYIENAQLDNNRVESQLKLVVRDRKNAMFHQTQAGADVGDVITSLIATVGLAGGNVFEYFNLLQRERVNVAKSPDNYLPWNYQQE